MMSCFKKIQFACLLLLTHTAFGGTMGPDYNAYDGVYVGVDVGVAVLNDAVSTNFPSTSIQLAHTGVVGGGLIGYDFSVGQRFKVGVEFLANAAGLSASSRRFAENTSYSVGESYYLAPRVLPGFLFYDKVVGHLILGYTNASVNFKDNGQTGFINKTANQSGFQAGLGMKVELIQNFTLRADAVYSIYQTLSGTGSSNTNLYAYQKYSNQFSSIEGNLIFIYKFVNL